MICSTQDIMLNKQTHFLPLSFYKCLMLCDWYLSVRFIMIMYHPTQSIFFPVPQSLSSFLVHPSCLRLLVLTNHTASSSSAAHGRSIRNKNSLLKCQYFIFVLGQKYVQLLSTGLCCVIFHQLLWFIVFTG